MAEEIIVQTIDEVNNIDHAKETINLINNQQEEIQNNMDTISEQLSNIQDNIININSDGNEINNLSTVTTLLEDIDTTIVESQNQDILDILDKQQKQINTIEEKIDLIISKIEM